MREVVVAYRFSVEKPEGKRLSVEREDNIKIDLREIRWEAWTGFIWFMIGPVADCSDCGLSVMTPHKTKV
jgi:hypothetical protein